MRRPPPGVVLAGAAFVALGFPIGALGVVWPTMRIETGRPLGDLGLLLLALTSGYFVASLSAGRLRARVRATQVLVGGSVAAGAGALLLTTGSWWGWLVGAGLIGVGTGALEAVLNGHVALTHSSRVLNVLHAGFGVGATLGPLLGAFVVERDGPWRSVFVALALGWLVLGVGFARSVTPWAGEADPVPASAPIAAATPPAGGEGRPGRTWSPLLVAAVVGFALYVSLETATGQWAFVLLTDDRGVSVRAAGVVVAAYWGALTVGRLGLGVAGVGSRPTLHWSAAGAFVALAVVAGGGRTGAVVGVPLAGLALAGLFPAMMAVTPERFGRDAAVAVVGYQLAASSLGTGIGPALGGVAVERAGPAALGGLLWAMSAVFLAVVATTEHLSRRGRPERAAARATSAPTPDRGGAAPPPGGGGR